MRKWFPLLLLGVAVLSSALAWPFLPETLPTHWGIDGEVDRTSPKWVALVIAPALIAFMWGGFRLMPRLDPRRANYSKFEGSYETAILTVMALMVALHLVTIAVGLGVDLPVPRLVGVGVGLLFLVIGNLLPRARPTFFFGIRNAWTLSNERVWARTHRIGGYLFVTGGLLLIVLALLAGPRALAVSVIGVVAAVLLLNVYSFVLWRREVGPG